MAEWFKAAVLKTADRKVRGFESYSLRQATIWYPKIFPWEGLLISVTGQSLAPG
jgi:hypothetical protein